MPRLLVLALWLLATPAFALSAIVFDGPQHGAAGYSGPGTLVSGAAAWWGLRAYNATWADGAHAAIRINRNSDSHICDVLLTTAGALGNTSNCSTGGDNGTSNVTWCNATTCNMLTWYDQSGNSRDAVYASGGAQTFNPSATISSQSVSDVAGNSGYCSSGTVSLPQTVSVSTVYDRTTAVTSISTAVTFDTTPSQVGASSTAANAFIYAGTVVGGSAAAADSAYHAVQAIFNGSSSELYVDGNAFTSLNPGTGSSSAAVICIGSASAGVNAMQGFIREGGIWPSAAAATFASNLSALNSNQHTYWGF